jgi:hypothetical protein
MAGRIERTRYNFDCHDWLRENTCLYSPGMFSCNKYKNESNLKLQAIVHTINQTPARPRDGPGVLVMLPTRELALQVEEVAKEYCRLMNLQVTCCYGGASKQGQASKLRQGLPLDLIFSNKCIINTIRS